MARQHELIVFDWDGTLMDSAAAIVLAIQAACRDIGTPVPDETTARHVIGLGLEDALAHAAPQLAPHRYPELAQRYRYHYLSRDQELMLFAGSAELIEDLHGRGFMLAIATGKSRAGLDRVLKQTGMARWFHATRCADECHPKPHPEMLLELMDEFAVDATQTLMIGDTTHDLDMARNAGVTGLAVTYGAHPEAVLAQAEPSMRFASMAALADWLRNHG